MTNPVLGTMNGQDLDSNSIREWALLFWTATTVVVLQAVVLFPNLRSRIALLDLPALVLGSLAFATCASAAMGDVSFLVQISPE